MAESYTTRDGTHRTTIIERRSTGTGLMLGMIVIIALIAAIAYFLLEKDAREQKQADAVISAAQSVDDAAKDAGTAIDEAAKRIVPKD